VGFCFLKVFFFSLFGVEYKKEKNAAHTF